MSKIILTKKQAEFIEGFKKKYRRDNDKTVEFSEILPPWASQALHNLMQFGFGKGLEDANGKEVSNSFYDKEDDFQHDQKPLLIEAIMHGYEVEKDKNVILYIEFSNFNDYGDVEKRKLYYGIESHVTVKSIASHFNLKWEKEKEKVEKLKAQGWKVEEV